MATGLKLIVGLGNPGKDYEQTRHNLGFLTVTSLAKKEGLRFKRSLLFKSFIAPGRIEGHSVILAKPLTFMNLSGWAVGRLVKRYQIDPKDLLIVCDDINLDLGILRLRPSGSDGGHNGLSSVIAALKTEHFSRLRMGVAGEHKGQGLADFVLSEFSRKETGCVSEQIERAGDCCISWMSKGVVKTMDKFNKG